MSGHTLVLCIDRDDDIGYKANVVSPCIGRGPCLAAASALGVSDPEDSDTNAIFQAIKTHDELLAKGDNVEVAVLAGNHTNMLDGDRRIGEQLDAIIAKHEIVDCVLISDGAEDEYVLPIIQSRIKVVSIVRVTIKQLPNVEGTFYIIKKLFNDPKIAKGILVPLGAVLILFAVLAFIVPAVNAILIVLGVVGLYAIFKGFGISDTVLSALQKIGESFKNGKFAGISYLCTSILLLVGILSGIITVITLYPTQGYAGAIYLIMTFLYGSLIWFFAGVLVACVGKIADYLQNDKMGLKRIFVVPFFVVSGWLIAYGALTYLMSVYQLDPFKLTPMDGLISLIVMSVFALIIAFIGIYFRPHFQHAITQWIEKRRREELEIEQMKKEGKTHYRRVKF